MESWRCNPKWPGKYSLSEEAAFEQRWEWNKGTSPADICWKICWLLQQVLQRPWGRDVLDLLLEELEATGMESLREKVGRVQVQVKWASEAMKRNLGFILIVVGKHVRKICCLFLRWETLSIHLSSVERSWPGLMPDQQWVHSRHQVQVPHNRGYTQNLAVTMATLALPVPLGSSSSPRPSPVGAGSSLQSVAQCKSGACRLVHSWFVMYPHWCSFESSGRTWIPETMIPILSDCVISLNVHSGTHLCLLELMAEALSARQLSVQNPPGACLDGCAFSQVHPLEGMILIDKLICNTPLTKWQKHSLSHTPKYRSNYLTVWNYHSHVKDLITFPLVTTVGRALIYLFF